MSNNQIERKKLIQPSNTVNNYIVLTLLQDSMRHKKAKKLGQTHTVGLGLATSSAELLVANSNPTCYG